jgi:hypothetical protein
MEYLFKRNAKPVNYLRFDSSTFSLIAANIITLIIAVLQHWSLITLLWIYWFQSIIIGFFNFIRILRLKKFNTDNFKMNGVQPQATSKTKYMIASFFVLHYGIFHFVYFIFLMVASIATAMKGFSFSTIWFVLLSAAIFFANHLFSFLKRKASNKEQNIGAVLFFPYARIIPMHLCIIFGFMFSGSAIGLIIFTALKTIADVIMHQVEHAM